MLGKTARNICGSQTQGQMIKQSLLGGECDGINQQPVGREEIRRLRQFLARCTTLRHDASSHVSMTSATRRQVIGC